MLLLALLFLLMTLLLFFFVVISNIQETAKNINMHPSLILRDDMLVALSKLKVFPFFMS
jgi:hypothetical protein